MQNSGNYCYKNAIKTTLFVEKTPEKYLCIRKYKSLMHLQGLLDAMPLWSNWKSELLKNWLDVVFVHGFICPAISAVGVRLRLRDDAMDFLKMTEIFYQCQIFFRTLFLCSGDLKIFEVAIPKVFLIFIDFCRSKGWTNFK